MSHFLNVYLFFNHSLCLNRYHFQSQSPFPSRFPCATTRASRNEPYSSIVSRSQIILSVCLWACLSLAWRVMVVVSGRGSSGRSVTLVEDTPINGTAGHVRSCSDLHGGGCARIRRSCSCGTAGRRICRSRGVSAPRSRPRNSLSCVCITLLTESSLRDLSPSLYLSLFLSLFLSPSLPLSSHRMSYI